jgi:hypothetical protein
MMALPRDEVWIPVIRTGIHYPASYLNLRINRYLGEVKSPGKRRDTVNGAGGSIILLGIETPHLRDFQKISIPPNSKVTTLANLRVPTSSVKYLSIYLFRG